MNTTAPEITTDEAAYAAQIANIARCLATGSVNDIRDTLAGPAAFDRLVLFVDGNFQKRVNFLMTMAASVAPAFENFEQIVSDYVWDWPAAAVGERVSDVDSLLAWMSDSCVLTPVQRDYIDCQRAREYLGVVGFQKRMAHIRYQERLSLARRLLKELDADDSAAARIAAEINPLSTWVTYRTNALLGEQTTAPVRTIMFAANDGTSTVIPTPETASLLELLAARGPMTISSWACLAEVETSELIEVLGSLAKLGLVALS